MITAVKQTLQGKRVRFTPLQLDNIYTHFAWNNDPELNHLDSELPYAKESFGEFKRRFERLLYHPPFNSQDFEIYAEDGTLIGVAFIADISEHNRHCTISITIGDRDYWGKGYGRDALKVVLDYCFGELGMHRVDSQTFEYNMAWKRLVEWAGFNREGVQRDYLFRDGRYWDKEVYSLLLPEYRSRNLTVNGTTDADTVV